MLMSEWSAHWQGFGVGVALALAIGGFCKFWNEYGRIKRQKIQEESLKRTEFFLSQHRRLFDDVELSWVLSKLDGDYDELKLEENWDKNRKFLTFVEEIEFLVRVNKIKADAACYMFGYYAVCARDGENFKFGIDMTRMHWGVFFDFCDRYEEYKKNNKDGPPKNMEL
ncbi:hypothetical protein K7N18_32775 [Burkholderia arboris]|uniref:hypothetical protein n=1 Tax=Burkholderia arboris TaxID=488730 RepID=UPI001CA3A74E|nr:hypothetical protein [Burkholderia arboris]MBY8609597.1 hypothetical protein [Burkholderia arboris]